MPMLGLTSYGDQELAMPNAVRTPDRLTLTMVRGARGMRDIRGRDFRAYLRVLRRLPAMKP